MNIYNSVPNFNSVLNNESPQNHNRQEDSKVQSELYLDLQ
jgi:hypothetical protein